jgi:hypothetical protein
MGPAALVVLAAAVQAGALAPPPGTTRVFGHICEEAHLQEIARAHALPAARAKIFSGKRTSKAASKKGEPRPPVTLCVLGDFGFSRANIYLQLEAGQRVWLYDAAAADRLAAATPLVTLALDARGRLVVGCPTCESVPTPLQASEDGVVGAVWLDLAAGRLHVREHGSRRELAAPAGVAVRDRLYVATPSPEPTCGECDLMALSIFLPRAEARGWAEARRAIKTGP